LRAQAAVFTPFFADADKKNNVCLYHHHFASNFPFSVLDARILINVVGLLTIYIFFRRLDKQLTWFIQELD
jgi:hypothetical protein